MTTRAKAQARELLERQKYQIPVDVHQIALTLGLQIFEQEMEPYISGLLVRRGSKGVIAVNSRHHINRRRFTIAHEIGHFVLDHGGLQFIDAAPVFFRDEKSAQGTSYEEVEANSFAAELLMPEQSLQNLLRNNPIDAFDEIALQILANRFEVSTQALTIRLVNLRLITSWSGGEGS